MAKKLEKQPNAAGKQRKKTISPKNGSDITKHQFKPGQTGNPNGRPKSYRTRIQEMEQTGKLDPEAVILAIQKEALKGDVRAAEWLASHGHGKPSQSIDVTSKGQGIRGVIIDYSDSK